jgi:FMN phosphatase YigB (HAD superfamily)
MKDNIILTDADGVLLDWENHFHAYMHSQGHERAYDVERASSYWKEREYPGLSRVEARKAVYHYNTSAWMLGLPAYKDARSGVATLVEAGYKFVAITAMGLDPYAKQAREINLERMFGYDVFEDVIVTDMYDPDSKRPWLEKYHQPGRIWIEDKPSNAEMGAEMGLRTFLMLHPHNEDYQPVNDIESVSSWVQLCDSLLD